MPEEWVGDAKDIKTATHPLRSDAPAYRTGHNGLMTDYGPDCLVCDPDTATLRRHI